jgi:hypothetical protein
MAADPWWLAELDELRDIALEGIDPRLRLLTRPQVTQLLALPREALLSPAVRQRLGLPAVRVGRRMRFRMLDVARLVSKGMEFPTAAPAETGPTDVLTTIPSRGS